MTEPTVKDYEQALDLLSTEPDFKKLCYAVAKNNPEVLVKAAKMSLGYSYTPSIQEIVMSIVEKDGKARAVQYYRETQKASLREAVNFVNALAQ